MTTHSITPQSTFSTNIQVPNGGLNLMTDATSVVEAMAQALSNRSEYNKDQHNALVALFNALSPIAAKINAANTFSQTQLFDNGGASQNAAIEIVKNPTQQTGNSSNKWTHLMLAHTGFVSGQEMKVHLYVGAQAEGRFALVSNAEWVPSLQAWRIEATSRPCWALFMRTNGLALVTHAAASAGTTWTDWDGVSHTVAIPLRSATGGQVGPNSFDSNGNFSHDSTLLSLYSGGIASTLAARGTFWPIHVIDTANEPVGTISVNYHSVYGGETLRIRERTNEMVVGTPTYQTRASVNTVAGDLVTTMSYTATGSTNSFEVHLAPASGTPDDAVANSGLIIKGISRTFLQTYTR